MKPLINENSLLALEKLSKPCRLCPWECMADRTSPQLGKCRSGIDIKISSYNIHTGEEPPISGTAGSGTIFFTNCSLACKFCQNYPISQLGNGKHLSIEQLADVMLELQERNAHNINLVTPSHMVHGIVRALTSARENGLKLPVVYNCGGYESVNTLRLLEGFVDIYMPDAKYSDNAIALKYSGIEDYWDVNKAALIEMQRQAGKLQMDSSGVAVKGLLIRHLVLPGRISGSEKILRFIAEEISTDTYMSIMAQYHPAHRSSEYPELSRKISAEEYEKIIDLAEKLGLKNCWIQDL